MRQASHSMALLLALLGAAWRPAGAEGITAPKEASSARLAREAGRVLRDRCISCHNEAKHKGDLVMTSREALVKGGADGAVVVPGDAEGSLLAMALLEGAEPRMPPKDPLSAAEIKLLHNWIDAGAPWDAEAIKPDTPAAAVELGALPDSYHPAFALALAPDEKRLAAARGDSILIFDLSGAEPALAGKIDAHRDAVRSLAWDAAGARLASGSFRRIVVHLLPPPGAANVDFAPPGAEVVLSEGILGRVSALAFSPDGKTLYSADATQPGKGNVRVWDLPARSIAASWIAHEDEVEAMAMDAEGKRLFTGGADGMVKMWSTADRALERKFEGHTGHVLGLALKAGGKAVEGGARLASASADQQVKVWDIETGEQKVAIAGHPLAATALAWLGESAQLVSAGEDGAARLLNETKEGPERAMPGAPEPLLSIAATRDGAKVFAGCQDGKIYCWDKDGKALPPLGVETPRAATAVAIAQPVEAK